jgi:hypothetical protein
MVAASCAAVGGLKADPAATIDYVLLQKTHDFIQDGDTSTSVASGSIAPASFIVSLEGSNLANYTGSLSFTSPGGSGTVSGVASYDALSDKFRYDADFTGASANADLNAAFADGTYDVNVDGNHVSLGLTGGLFPATPVATITGTTGVWGAGTFTIQAGQSFSVASIFTDASNYSMTHVNLDISGNGFDQFDDNFTAGGQVDVASGALVSGQSYNVRINFSGIVNFDDTTLSPIKAAAIYASETNFTLEVVPEPAAAAAWCGALALATAGLTRRRRGRSRA